MELCEFLLLLLTIFSTCHTLQVYKVNEESGKDDYIGNIPQDFNLPLILPGETPRKYKILSGEELVRVERETGKLYTAVRLDRDKLCPDNPPICMKDIEVGVLPTNYFQLKKIQLIIADLNDNVPLFPSPNIVKEISESALVGSVIRLDSAIDPDLGDNSIKTYEISSSPPKSRSKNKRRVQSFELNVLENIDGTKIPQLSLIKGLDREKVSSYEILLYAIDGGSPALTGTATIQIVVTDSNDHQPTFMKDRYVVSVSEDVDVGYEIIKLKATDLDVGLNAQIEYTFPSMVSEQDREIFNLNTETGSITIKGRGLDYENKTIHHLTIEARDRGSSPASVYATVTVQVQDVNDEKPNVNVNFMDLIERPSKDGLIDMDTEPVLIKENVKVGTYLAFVTVTDRDTGMNGNVSCRLKEPTSFELEKLNDNDNRYLIKTKSELDRETQRLHNIEIDAWDLGTPSLSSSKRIVVELFDENDNSPSFGKENYLLEVSENVSPGEEVATVRAQDLDDGVNAAITYSSAPALQDTIVPFLIGATSGRVIFKASATPLDAESITETFLLKITATDHGIPPRNTSTILRISIVDENDNPPIFRENNYIVRVKENILVGTLVGSVFADDADVNKETNARITYSFESDDLFNAPFTITPDTGEIHFIGPSEALDREARQSQPYVLTILARDHGKVSLTDECTVEIYILDVNDNNPSIKYPNVSRDVSFLYIRKTSIGKTTALIAPDQDTDKDMLFEDSTANYSDNSFYSAIATQPKRVDSVKEFVLIGKSGSPKVWTSKSQPLVITQIQAIDPDEGENGRVRFAMAKGNTYGYFKVDMVTGNVILDVNNEAELRKMKRGCHVIEVTVSDLGKPSSLSTPAWVSIYITDANPGSVNVTEVRRECKNNSFFPVILKKDDDNSYQKAGMKPIILIIVIASGALFLILLIVMMVLLVNYKYHCCQSKKSRTYNLRNATDIYKDASCVHESSVVRRGNKGSLHQHRMTNGTVDSRSSFCSEWTASQVQIGQEKEQLMIPGEPVEGSLASQNSAKDSGTGDSMPNDVYHSTNPALGMFKHQYPNQPYQRHSQAYNPPHHQPLHIYQGDAMMAATDGGGRHMVQPLHGNRMVFTQRCTTDCRLYGHGDNCWMPDSLQRPSSRMALDYESHSLKYQKRAMTPNSYLRHHDIDGPDYHDMRYSIPPSTTPYYYEPGRKFDHSTQQHGMFSTFRDDNLGSEVGSHIAPSNLSRKHSASSGVHHQSGYLGQNQMFQPAYPQSHAPYGSTSPVPHGGPSTGKAYINLQGGEYGMDAAALDEVHSNLSSASSGNQIPSHPHSFPQQAYPQGQSYIPHYPSSHQGYGSIPPIIDHHGEPNPYGNEPMYEQDFSATNLLLSPVDSEPDDYKQRLEQQMQQLQQQQRQQQQQHAQPEYNPGHHTEAEDNQLLADENSHEQGEEELSTEDKLSTIREELDAEQVIGEIDGLLL